jgi:hypothetical protein
VTLVEQNARAGWRCDPAVRFGFARFGSDSRFDPGPRRSDLRVSIGITPPGFDCGSHLRFGTAGWRCDPGSLTEWIDDTNVAGLTASASAPEILVQQVIGFARERLGVTDVEELLTVKEDVHFSLPHELDRLEPRPAAAGGS